MLSKLEICAILSIRSISTLKYVTLGLFASSTTRAIRELLEWFTHACVNVEMRAIFRDVYGRHKVRMSEIYQLIYSKKVAIWVWKYTDKLHRLGATWTDISRIVWEGTNIHIHMFPESLCSGGHTRHLIARYHLISHSPMHRKRGGLMIYSTESLS